MRFRATANLTDFDGRFYSKGEEVDLDASQAHSHYLKPMEETVPVASPEVVSTIKKRRSTGVRRKKAEE